MKKLLTDSEIVYRSDRTQVSTTGITYYKTGKLLAKLLQSKAKIISLAAGLDQTKENLLAGLGSGNYIVDEHEPYPQKRKNPPEYTYHDNIPSNKYDATVIHNFLNRLTKPTRDEVTETLFRVTKKGGYIIIGTCGWKGDIEKVKNFDPTEDEEKAIWVKRKSKGTVIYSYQKGYDNNELKDYIQYIADQLNIRVEIKKINGLAKNAVQVKIC